MPAGYKKVSTMSKGQKGFLNQLLGQMRGQSSDISQNSLFQSGSNYLQGLLSGSPDAIKSFEAPEMRRFYEQTVPALAERFSGMGAGAQKSSAFQQALGQSGAALSEGLASLRGQLQMGAAGQALGYAQQPISNLQGFGQMALGANTMAFMPKQQPFWQQLLSGLAGGAAQGLGSAGSMWGLSKFGGGLSGVSSAQQQMR